MNNYTLKDVSELRFNKYETSERNGTCETVRLPLFDTTREEAIQLREIIQRNPLVGCSIIFLNNGNHI